MGKGANLPTNQRFWLRLHGLHACHLYYIRVAINVQHSEKVCSQRSATLPLRDSVCQLLCKRKETVGVAVLKRS